MNRRTPLLLLLAAPVAAFAGTPEIPAGNAPDAALVAVENLAAAGDLAGAKQAISELRKKYPADRRATGLAACLDDPRIVFTPPSVRLADRPASERIAFRLLEHRFLALKNTPVEKASETASELLRKLDPLLDRTPGLDEALILRAKLAIVADDAGRGRAAARILGARGLGEKSASPEARALYRALVVKKWILNSP